MGNHSNDNEADQRYFHLIGFTLKACPNGKCFTVKHAKTLLFGKTFFRLATLFCAV